MTYSVICGTNRKEALSFSVAQAYRDLLLENGIDATLVDLSKLPIDFAFSALYDNHKKNEAFNEFDRIMQRTEKYVFIIPEYNGSFPGVLKTFIDGLTYPSTFRNKKAALVGVSSGGEGASLALSHFTDILNFCGMHVLAYKARLEHIERHVESNAITNPEYMEKLRKQITQFLEF